MQDFNALFMQAFADAIQTNNHQRPAVSLLPVLSQLKALMLENKNLAQYLAASISLHQQQPHYPNFNNLMQTATLGPGTMSPFYGTLAGTNWPLPPTPMWRPDLPLTMSLLRQETLNNVQPARSTSTPMSSAHTETLPESSMKELIDLLKAKKAEITHASNSQTCEVAQEKEDQDTPHLENQEASTQPTCFEKSCADKLDLLLTALNNLILVQTHNASPAQPTKEPESANTSNTATQETKTQPPLETPRTPSTASNDSVEYNIHYTQPYKVPPSDEIKLLLNGELNLPQYAQLCADAGIDTLEDFAALTPEIIAEIGINKIGHQQRILRYNAMVQRRIKQAQAAKIHAAKLQQDQAQKMKQAQAAKIHAAKLKQEQAQQIQANKPASSAPPGPLPISPKLHFIDHAEDDEEPSVSPAPEDEDIDLPPRFPSYPEVWRQNELDQQQSRRELSCLFSLCICVFHLLVYFLYVLT